MIHVPEVVIRPSASSGNVVLCDPVEGQHRRVSSEGVSQAGGRGPRH